MSGQQGGNRMLQNTKGNGQGTTTIKETGSFVCSASAEQYKVTLLTE